MIKTFSGILCVVFLFTGCITKEIPSYETYSLLLTSTILTSKTKNTNKSIQVEEPKALRSINTTSILYSKKAFQQNEYVLSKWSDNPSKMIQKVLSQQLAKEKIFSFVSTPDIKRTTDYKLSTQIINLLHEFENEKSYATLIFKVYLSEKKTNQIFVKEFKYKTLVKENNAYGFVKEANISINNFSNDLSVWLSYTLQ